MEQAIATIDDLMTRYGIEAEGTAKDFDSKKARNEQTDELAYELGVIAYEQNGYSTDKKINFEARAHNCASGVAFAEFVRGWRDAADFEKERYEKERKVRAQEVQLAVRASAINEKAYIEFRKNAVYRNEQKIVGWGAVSLIVLMFLAASMGSMALAVQNFLYGIFVVLGLPFCFAETVCLQ
ncbi:MAG: hypothetical protein EoVTN8_311 [Fluviibacter phosphoraccumulans EoVTN8]